MQLLTKSRRGVCWCSFKLIHVHVFLSITEYKFNRYIFHCDLSIHHEQLYMKNQVCYQWLVYTQQTVSKGWDGHGIFVIVTGFIFHGLRSLNHNLKQIRSVIVMANNLCWCYFYSLVVDDSFLLMLWLFKSIPWSENS